MLEKKRKEHGIQVVIDMNGIEADDEHQEAEIATVAAMRIEGADCQPRFGDATFPDRVMG